MTRVRVHNLAVSLDGYAAGPDQTVDDRWERVGGSCTSGSSTRPRPQAMIGQDGRRRAASDDEFLPRGDAESARRSWVATCSAPSAASGATEDWRGWWGDEPPYHHPVFVLTHYARQPLEMDGGTTFHFVTDGLESALAQATQAADGLDVRIGGGGRPSPPPCVRAWSTRSTGSRPEPAGRGERLYGDVAPWPTGWTCVETAAGEGALHVRFVRDAAAART